MHQDRVSLLEFETHKLKGSLESSQTSLRNLQHMVRFVGPHLIVTALPLYVSACDGLSSPTGPWSGLQDCM